MGRVRVRHGRRRGCASQEHGVSSLARTSCAMRRLTRAAALLIAGMAAFSAALARCEDRFDGLDAYVREGMETWKVPGLALAVVKDGQVVVSRSYGTRQIGHDEPVTSETLFPIASCTKTFT